MEIKNLKNKHKGERCFIIGTGPSLMQTSLELIRDEILFGCNTLYKGLDYFWLKCKYYAVSDEQVWLHHYKGILGLDTILFVSGKARNHYKRKREYYQQFAHPNLVVFEIPEIAHCWYTNTISTDLEKGVMNGDTVIVDICLQAAYYMGFNTTYLVGVDCNYDGEHHFDGSYADSNTGGASGHWQNCFKAYNICQNVFKKNHRTIINVNMDSKLDAFPKQTLKAIFNATNVS